MDSRIILEIFHAALQHAATQMDAVIQRKVIHANNMGFYSESDIGHEVAERVDRTSAFDHGHRHSFKNGRKHSVFYI